MSKVNKGHKHTGKNEDSTKLDKYKYSILYKKELLFTIYTH